MLRGTLDFLNYFSLNINVDFKFIRIPNLEEWVVLAPKRSKRPRPDDEKKKVCIFCPGIEAREREVYRIGGETGDKNWSVLVLNNKFPFAPTHELVILTPDCNKHFSDLTLDQIRLGLEAYVNRFNTHVKKGAVCIFGNVGRDAGESIHHPHAQLAVVPRDVQVVVPRLEQELSYRGEYFAIGKYMLICPPYSQWPDEVWIIPQERGRLFGEITYEELENLAFVLKRVIKIFEIRHGYEFPYNYYIYPYHDWYLRIMPRAKIPGGFEIATGIFVNTQNPKKTMKFLKDHFFEEEEAKIKKHKAEYRRGV